MPRDDQKLAVLSPRRYGAGGAQRYFLGQWKPGMEGEIAQLCERFLRYMLSKPPIEYEGWRGEIPANAPGLVPDVMKGLSKRGWIGEEA
jgi:hypothetical protein